MYLLLIFEISDLVHLHLLFFNRSVVSKLSFLFVPFIVEYAILMAYERWTFKPQAAAVDLWAFLSSDIVSSQQPRRKLSNL